MSTVVTKNLAVQNSTGTASTNISFDGNKLVSTALDNSITATANLHDLGVGQTWQDVTASRAAGVTYTNTTGKPIFVSITGVGNTAGGYIVFRLNIAGNFVADNLMDTDAGATPRLTLSGIIPNGATYSITGGENAIYRWMELR